MLIHQVLCLLAITIVCMLQVLILHIGRELNRIYQLGTKAKIPRSYINDAGHTQLPPGTATAVALGPAPEKYIDPITKNLKLL